jgi:hypothetical protein
MLWYLTRRAEDELVAAGIPALKHRLLQQSSDVNVLTNVLTALGNYFRTNKAHADLFLQLGTLPVIVGLLFHDMPDIQAKASVAITSFTGTNDTIRNALCDAGAVGALAGVVSKGSGEARKRACGALWGLVLGGGGGQGGVDAVEGLLGSDGEEGVKAGLEGLSAGVARSEGKQRAFVEGLGFRFRV